VHFRVHARIDLADSFLAADVEKHDLFIRAHTDGKRAILRHFYTVNVTRVTAQISDVDARL